MTNPTGYSRTQIFLHWAIAVIIVFQFVAHDAIVNVLDAMQKELEIDPTEMIMSRMHVILGGLVFVLALWRVVLRFKRGAPAAPAGESAALQMVAKLTHVVLYGVIFMMPLSGMMTWFVDAETFGTGHQIGKFVMLAIVALHVLGALYHWLVLKSGVMQRMFRAG